MRELGQAGGHERVGGRVDRTERAIVAEGAPVPGEEPFDGAGVAEAVGDVRAGVVAQQVRGRDEFTILFGDEGDPFDYPWVEDDLFGTPFEAAQHGVDRDRHPGNDGGDVSVGQPGQLIAVIAAEGSDEVSRHGESPGRSMRCIGIRQGDGTAPL